jgi:hypothetical protein
MIVWGGHDGTSEVNTGGIYDPATGSWTATSTTGAPLPRSSHAAVWTGSRMIVWGGYGSYDNTGGIYDPATDSWTATSTTGAPSPRFGYSAVWTGSKMIVWGGSAYGGSLDTGGIYDPVGDSWTATPTTGAPTPRHSHTAVWTSRNMVVWGGTDLLDSEVNTGGIYDDAALYPPANSLYTVTPCRVLDTREAPWGAPLAAGTDNVFLVEGSACGIPSTAVAVSLNVTATQPTSAGHLRLYPAGETRPLASTVNYVAGQTRANNAITPLGPGGDLAVYVGQASGTVHVIIDVTGYFEP